LTNLTVNGQRFVIEEQGKQGNVTVNGHLVSVSVLKELGSHPLDLLVRTEGRVLRITAEEKDENEVFSIRLNGRPFKATLGLFEDLRPIHSKEQVQGPIVVTAPMAGRITSLKVAVGTPADEGQSLVVLEAMKMENEVASPKKGLVKEVYVKPGTLVKAGDKLALVE
jgi:biotin carboxyl carrier protein